MKTCLQLEPWCQTSLDCYFADVAGDDNNFFAIVYTSVVVFCFVISVRRATEGLREKNVQIV